jgi:pimeloyl-ACP methyl ester carboxylesterase
MACRGKAMSDSTKPGIIFCHGLWFDGSCFSRVIPLLQAAGYEALAAQYGLDTPEADVAAVKRTLERIEGPIMLVGHSYGGRVITAAGNDDRVAGLVYIAALAQDGDGAMSEENFPAPDVRKYLDVVDGRIWISLDGAACLAGDLPEEEQKLLWATQFPPAVDLQSRNAPGVAWKSKPSWYIVATRDRTIQPELQRFLARRMSATMTEIESSHSVMLSHPDAVVNVIVKAASTLS